MSAPVHSTVCHGRVVVVRLKRCGHPGSREIGFTKSASDNLNNKDGLHDAFVGERTLKNVDDRVGISILVDEPTSTPHTA